MKNFFKNIFFSNNDSNTKVKEQQELNQTSQELNEISDLRQVAKDKTFSLKITTQVEFKNIFLKPNPSSVKKFSLMKNLPYGWFTPNEMAMLYDAAKIANGNILEIGPYLGRSTIAIATALKEKSIRQIFDTVDFFPESQKEWDDLNQGYDLQDEYKNAWTSSKGLEKALIENLKKHDVSDFVSRIIKGNFLDVDFNMKYNMIFCDATHNVREIKLNIKRLNELLAPGGLLLCHDINKDKELIKELLNGIDLLYYTTHSIPADDMSLFIARKSFLVPQVRPEESLL